jgi:predicted metalloprotease with PDZ domain
MIQNRSLRFFGVSIGLALMAVATALAAPPTVSYLVAMPKPSSHFFEVTLRVEGVKTPVVDVAMPAWSPGAYAIGNYERNVQEFSATDGAGRTLPFEKTDTQTWRITSDGDSTVVVKYKYYAGPSMSPRATGFSLTQLEASHASVTGPNLFMYVVGKSPYPLAGPVRLTIDPPPGWKVYSPLEATDRANTFVAENYDTFVDAPFEVSPECKELTFEADGRPYHIVIHGDGNYDPEKLTADLKQIVTTEAALFGGPPFSQYVFFFDLRPGAQGSGGLEHLNSTSIMAGKYLFTNPEEYRRFLFVCAHEFFHVWNVKRIRPWILGPFDYTKEQNTRDLYVSEGMTSYYGALLLKRSGLWSRQEYFDYLTSQISTLQSSPGRHLMSAEMSSWETWNRSGNSPNNSIDYYNKGELLGWLIDLELRARTQNRRSLDDVFRYLFQTYGLPKPGFDDKTGFESAVELVARQGGAADPSFKEFFDRYVRGVDEIPWNRYLNRGGLVLEEKRDKPAPYLGFTFRTADNLLTISTMTTGTPAWDAGLDVNDVLLAWNGEKIDPSLFNDRLKEMKIGDTIDFVLFRGDRLLRVPVKIGQDEKTTYTVGVRKDASPEEQKIFMTWANESSFLAK